MQRDQALGIPRVREGRISDRDPYSRLDLGDLPVGVRPLVEERHPLPEREPTRTATSSHTGVHRAAEAIIVATAEESSWYRDVRGPAAEFANVISEALEPLAANWTYPLDDRADGGPSARRR